MKKAKLVNGCHMFVVSSHYADDGLAAHGNKFAYAAYIDWPVEGLDSSQVLSRHQAICSVTDFKSSSFHRDNICSSYFPFNQSGPTMALVHDDPYISGLPFGGRVNHEDKSSFNFIPHYMNQQVCEPEITCLSSVDEISISIRQRPIDKLYTYLLAQIMHTPQARMPKIDPNPLFNKKYSEADIALLTFNQDLKRLILRQGPTETCLMLTQICTNERARYYVNHGYLESCAASQGSQTRPPNTSLNQSRMFGDSRAGGTSVFQNGDTSTVESSLIILRTDSNIHSLALQLLVLMGSYQMSESMNDLTRNQTLNLNTTRFENQPGLNFIERDRGAILNPQYVDQISCSSLLSCCLYKYFARLIRPLWNSELFQIISEVKTGKQGRIVRESVSSKTIGLIIESLLQFQLFLKANQASISEHRRSKDNNSYSRVPSGSQGMHSRPVHPEPQNIGYVAAIIQLINQTSQYDRLEQCELTEIEIEIRRQLYELVDKSIAALQVYKVLVDNLDILISFTGPQLTQLVSTKVSSLVLNPASSELIRHSLTLLLLNTKGIDAERRADRLTNNFMHYFSKSDAVFAISLRK